MEHTFVRHIGPFVIAASFLMIHSVRSADTADASRAETIKQSQEWAIALGQSVKAQAEAGVKDRKLIRKKAIKDSELQEKKMRKAMKAMGFTQQKIDDSVKEGREQWLDSFTEEFVKHTLPKREPYRPSATETRNLPVARPIPNEPGMVYSPFRDKNTPNNGGVDVSALPSGSKSRCPYTGKVFLVP